MTFLPSNRSLFLAAFAVLCLVSPAKAQINDEGAAKLKTMLEKEFMQQVNIQNNLSQDGIRTEGQLVVEPAGSYYAVTFPHITAGNKETGTHADIGMIAANVTPGEKDDTWKMAIAMPSPMTVYEEGEAVFKLDLGKQHFVGLWDEDLEYFTKIDLAYEGIKASIPASDMTFSIPALKMFSNFNESEPGIFTGPTNIQIIGMNSKKNDGTELMSIGDLRLDAAIDGFSADSWINFMDSYEAMTDTFATDPENISKEKVENDIKNVQSTLVAYIDTLKGGFTSQYTVKDMVIHYPENKDIVETLDSDLPEDTTKDKLKKVEIASSGFGFDFKNTSETAKQINLRINYDGIKVTPTPEAISDHIPHAANFDISLKNLPIKELFEAGQQIAASSGGNKDAAKMAGMQAMFTLPQILSKAGTSLNFNNTSIENETSKVSLSGAVNASAAAPFGATANLVAQISDLDGLMKTAQEEAKNNNSSFIAQAYPVLLILKGIAETTPGPNGKILSLFNIVMNEQGQTTVNGNSMDMITGGGAQ